MRGSTWSGAEVVRGRHLTTAVTLLVLVAILVLGVLLGVKALFAPIPGGEAGASASPSCTTKAVKKGQRVVSTQVQVSVYNGGTRAGLADETMNDLRGRGFRRGEIGNAPEDSKVKRVQVWTTERIDPAARLVANQFGAGTRVRQVKTDLGPGVDVVVGDGFRNLAQARRVLVAKRSSSVCVQSTGSSPSAG